MSVQTVKMFACVSVCAGLAAQARSQGLTQLDLQASYDGIFWHDVLPIGGGGGRVLIRATVSWLGPGATPAGFASLTWQPVIRGVRPGLDRIAAFADGGNNTNGGSVVLDSTPYDGPFGRISPFAAVGPPVTTRYVGHTHTTGSGGAPPGEYLRIARNDVTRWMGTGPTSGAGSVNNFNGTGGIACAQKPAAFITPIDPPFNPATQNVVIFQFALELGPLDGGFSGLDIAAPIDGMSRNQATGQRIARWFRDPGDNAGQLLTEVIVDPAHLVIPGPGGAVILLLAGAGLRRRVRGA